MNITIKLIFKTKYNFLNSFVQDDAAQTYGFVGAGSDACAGQMVNSGRKRRNAPGPPNDQQRKDLAENLLRVDVYFETLSVQSITEDPTYNVSIE